MIERIKAELNGSGMTVKEEGTKILIFDIGAPYPEDCYSIVQDEQGGFTFNEVHRDNVEKIFASDNPEAVVIYAVAYAKKDTMRNGDDEFRKTIMSFASEHSAEEIKEYLNVKIDGNLYSVGADEYDKISLVFVGEKGSLYYHNKPIHLVQNASIKRCYLVIYNLVSILMNLKKYYEGLTETEKAMVSFDELSDRFILV